MNRVHYISDSTDVYFNLALEEYFIRNVDFSDMDLLFIYRNTPSIVLGKNQNFYQEVNLFSFFHSEYLLARRISGGGTVVHDLGNINFAFFERHNLKRVNNYDSSVGRIVEALKYYGISCHKNERNAILLENGKKISGSAQFSSNKGILSHLTILFEADLEQIDKLIAPNPYQIHTKASPSVRSTIDNLGHYLPNSSSDFIHQMIDRMGYADKLDTSQLEQSDILKLKTEKYQDFNFLLDTSANSTIRNNYVEIRLEKSIIEKIDGIPHGGDYLGRRLHPSEIPLSDILWELLRY